MMRARVRPILWVVLTMLAIVGVATAWAMDSPVGAGPDEPNHILHAYGVATGQTLPSNETIKVVNGVSFTQVKVPAALEDYLDVKCYQFMPSRVPSCGFVNAHSSDTATVTLTSYMTRYPPLYYAAVGTVIRVALAAGASGHKALVTGRIASGVACLGLLVLAGALLRSRFSGPGPTLMILAGLTPVSMSLFSTVNPNGLEIAAAVLSASFVCVLRDDYRHSPHARPLILTGFVLSLTILTWTRPLSLVWSGLLLGVLLLPGGIFPALQRRRRPELVALTLVGACLAAAAVWLHYSTETRTLSEQGVKVPWSQFALWVKIVLTFLKLGNLVQQMIGLMGSDTLLPLLLVLTWCLVTAVVVSLFALGARRASTSMRQVTAFVLASMAVVAGYSVLTAFGWQGRYWLPSIAAALILCVPSLQGRHLDPRTSKRLALGATMLFVAMQMYGFLWHLWRYVYGVHPTFPRFEAMPLPGPTSGWLPPLSQPLTFTLLFLGTGVLTGMLLREPRQLPLKAERPPEVGRYVDHDHSDAPSR